jgi:hypothetical protein
VDPCQATPNTTTKKSPEVDYKPLSKAEMLAAEVPDYSKSVEMELSITFSTSYGFGTSPDDFGTSLHQSFFPSGEGAFCRRQDSK